MPRYCSVLLAFVGLLTGASALAQEPTLFQPTSFRGTNDVELRYQLLTPAAAAQPGDEKFPLVLFLHGAGERGSDNKAQLKHGTGNFATDANRQKYPCYVVAPQCSSGQWWNTQADLLLELIADLQKQHRIDPQRIYVTGLSMGGFGTWELITRKPELFAAAAPICGGGDPAKAAACASLPIWVFHGDRDTVVRPELSRNMVEALKKAGGMPKYTEYPGVGHDSWTATYADPAFMEWLFAQKRL